MATGVQDNFVHELRELMENYGVEFHQYGMNLYELITRDIDEDDENYIKIDIDFI